MFVAVITFFREKLMNGIDLQEMLFKLTKFVGMLICKDSEIKIGNKLNVQQKFFHKLIQKNSGITYI